MLNLRGFPNFMPLKKFLNLPTIVPICGGLGGQIFGYALYQFLLNKNKAFEVYADASAFSINNKYQLASLGGGVNQYVWVLSYYGIHQDKSSGVLSRDLINTFHFNKLNARFLKEGSN